MVCVCLGDAMGRRKHTTEQQKRNLELGLRLRFLRTSYFLKQCDVAKELGMSPSELCRIEGGHRYVNDPLIHIFATKYDEPFHKLWQIRNGPQLLLMADTVFQDVDRDDMIKDLGESGRKDLREYAAYLRIRRQDGS